jgi:hypothetical protein
VKLRNELVHYKSKLGEQMDRQKLFERLKQLRHASPPFLPKEGHMNFFPHHCLSAACAAWSVNTAVAMIDEFFRLLGTPSLLDSYRDGLSVC